MGDQAVSGTEIGMKERDYLGKGDRFDFGKCNGPVGHPRGDVQLDIWDWAQKKDRGEGGVSREI